MAKNVNVTYYLQLMMNIFSKKWVRIAIAVVIFAIVYTIGARYRPELGTLMTEKDAWVPFIGLLLFVLGGYIVYEIFLSVWEVVVRPLPRSNEMGRKQYFIYSILFLSFLCVSGITFITSIVYASSVLVTGTKGLILMVILNICFYLTPVFAIMLIRITYHRLENAGLLGVFALFLPFVFPLYVPLFLILCFLPEKTSEHTQ